MRRVAIALILGITVGVACAEMPDFWWRFSGGGGGIAYTACDDNLHT